MTRTETIQEEINISQDWCLGEGTFNALVDDLQSFMIENVVEFGSGVSSTRLALAMPHINLLSIESDPIYCEKTMQLLDRHVPEHRVEVQLRTLCWQRHGLGLYQSYCPGEFPSQIDAVIIDGPPFWTVRGREGCLYQVFNSLRIGGRVYLDDYERPDEEQTVRNWLAAYPGVFKARVLDAVPSKICVLEKTKEAKKIRLSWKVFGDNWYSNASRQAHALADRVFRVRKDV